MGFALIGGHASQSLLPSARPIVTFRTSYIESFGDGFMIMHYINVRLTLI